MGLLAVLVLVNTLSLYTAWLPERFLSWPRRCRILAFMYGRGIYGPAIPSTHDASPWPNKARPGDCLGERPLLRVPAYLQCGGLQVARFGSFDLL